MRLILGLVLLIGLFALLARMLPSSWSLPLYFVFLIGTILFVIRERRAISERRQMLERDLRRNIAARNEALQQARTQKEEQSVADGDPGEPLSS